MISDSLAIRLALGARLRRFESYITDQIKEVRKVGVLMALEKLDGMNSPV